MDTHHYLHSRNGCIGTQTDTNPEDIDGIVARLRSDPRGHLILHFHGGLVDKQNGMKSSEELLPTYSPSPASGGYPLFFIWESGPWETIRNNLTELADEPVFKQLLRKLVQYSAEHLGVGLPFADGRGTGRRAVGSMQTEISQAFEAFWSYPSMGTIPLHTVVMHPTDEARSASLGVDEDEIQADIEQDPEVQAAISSLSRAATISRSGFAADGPETPQSGFAALAAEVLLQAPDAWGPDARGPDARGGISMLAVAGLLGRMLRGVLARVQSGRDHGLYATCVEELVRAFKIAGSGAHEWAKALEWNRMKQDTIDAFGPDPDKHVGTALLSRLKGAIDNGYDLRRVTLIGHSTGAIYVANWLEHSANYLPADLKQDVVLLAPAITYERLAQTLDRCSQRIGTFRMFSMHDQYERDDQVLGDDNQVDRNWRRYLYPSSLLYLVSGILESRIVNGTLRDEPDMPLVGMERFYSDVATYDDVSFPAIARVRSWFAAQRDPLVWSVSSNAAPGFTCACKDHGGFTNEPQTVASLRHIVS